jgi:UDP-N-acetylglucosamine 2-epimerase (non-hydrolysing)
MRKGPVLLIVGTRPEVVKTAPVAFALKAAKIPFKLIGTGQQRQLCRQMLQTFGLRLDKDLALMRPNQAPGQVLTGAISALFPIYRKIRPSLVLVQGDTTSALAGALAAQQAGIPIGHIEAGLRSGDFSQPYPEEMNRVFIDRIAELHFAPTKRAKDNLLREGIRRSGIWVTGNTVVDAVSLILASSHVYKEKKLKRFLTLPGTKAILTAHRRENLGPPLQRIFTGIKRLLNANPDLHILYPVHLNPAIQKAARTFTHRRLKKTGPLNYADFIHTAAHCRLILSDSGGIQEEAPSLGVPVVLLREVNDRPEGTARLAGTQPGKINREAQKILNSSSRRRIANPFGDGQAAQRIGAKIFAFLQR